jgi:hypothetical protein
LKQDVSRAVGAEFGFVRSPSWVGSGSVPAQTLSANLGHAETSEGQAGLVLVQEDADQDDDDDTVKGGNGGTGDQGQGHRQSDDDTRALLAETRTEFHDVGLEEYRDHPSMEAEGPGYPERQS